MRFIRSCCKPIKLYLYTCIDVGMICNILSMRVIKQALTFYHTYTNSISIVIGLTVGKIFIQKGV